MDTRKEKFPYGIPGHNLSEIEREIPIEEPPVWPVNDKLKIIGKRRKSIGASLWKMALVSLSACSIKIARLIGRYGTRVSKIFIGDCLRGHWPIPDWESF